MDKVEINTHRGVFRINGADVRRASECAVLLTGGKRTKVFVTIDGAELYFAGDAEVENRSPETEERLHVINESSAETR